MNKISREKEEAYLLDLIRRESNIDIYGMVGIGKTYIIDRLAGRLAEEKTDKEIKYIKLRNTTDLLHLLNDIALILGEGYETPFYNFRNILDKNKEYSENGIVILFSAYLSSIKKTLLIFNDAHLVRDDVWDRFEKEILHFKYDENKANFRIITIGQKRRRWSFFRLRKQTVTFKLKLLTKENTSDMVKNLSNRYKFEIKKESAKLAFETIFRLTMGHPESICIAVKHWTETYTHPLDGKQIKEEYGECIKEIVNKFINVKIIPPLLEKLKEGEHYPSGETLFSFLQYLAPLRVFQPRLLRTALPILLPDFYQRKRAFFFDELFHAFYESLLVEENEEENGKYEMSAIVRHVLIEDLKKNDPDKLTEINKKINTAYGNLIEYDTVQRENYLFEKIYHALLPVTEGQKRENAVRSIIREHVEQYETDMEQLQDMLQKDSDLSKEINWNALFKSLYLKEGDHHNV